MLNNVQALRAAAAFLVVFVHLQALATALGLGPTAFEFGNSGVDVFFVISGLIMVLTTRRARPSPGQFMTNRVARIVPFYWLMTGAVFVLVLAVPSLFSGTQADLGNLLKSLFFVPYARADGLYFPIVFVGWTLNYEMAFYALFALGLCLPSRRLGFLLTLSALAVAVTAGALVKPDSVAGKFYSAPIILEFGLGMLLAAATPRLRPGLAPPGLVLALGLAAFVVMVAMPSLWPNPERLIAFGLPGAVLVFCAVYLESCGWSLRNRVVRLLGDASFAIYLTHVFATQAVTMAVMRLGLTAPWQLVAAMAAAFVLVSVIGVLVHLLVERPLSQAVKSMLLGRVAGPAPATAAADLVR